MRLDSPIFAPRPSRSDSLDDAQRALGWHDPGQLQPRIPEDRGEFVLGALAPTDNEHINIKELAPAGVVARRDDIVDDQNLSILVHGGAAVREDLYRALIVPIVEDILHDVGIAALRHRLEEVSGFEHAASRDAFRGHVLVFPGAGNDRKAGQREPPSASDSP